MLSLSTSTGEAMIPSSPRRLLSNNLTVFIRDQNGVPSTYVISDDASVAELKAHAGIDLRNQLSLTDAGRIVDDVAGRGQGAGGATGAADGADRGDGGQDHGGGAGAAELKLDQPFNLFLEFLGMEKLVLCLIFFILTLIDLQS